jgi:hypothetical protein
MSISSSSQHAATCTPNALRAVALSLFLSIGAAAALPALAQQDAKDGGLSLALNASAGLNGLGGDLVLGLTPKLNLRVGYHALTYTYTGQYTDEDPGLDYEGTADIASLSFLVDFYPFGRFLGITAGAYSHDQVISGFAEPMGSYTVGDRDFTPQEIGNLTADLRYEQTLMPYAGITLGNPTRGSRLKLHLQLGALYSGAPVLDLEGTELIAPTADNEVNFNEGLQAFEWLPVVNAGLTFRLR